MSLKIWYLKHFDKDALLEELSKPVEEGYIVIKEGDMLTRVKKEEVEDYINSLREAGEYYMQRYEKARREYGKDPGMYQ